MGPSLADWTLFGDRVRKRCSLWLGEGLALAVPRSRAKDCCCGLIRGFTTMLAGVASGCGAVPRGGGLDPESKLTSDELVPQCCGLEVWSSPESGRMLPPSLLTL